MTPEQLIEQQVTLLRTVAQRLVEGPQRLLEQQEALLAVIKSPEFQGDQLGPACQLLTETTARLMRVERVSIWRYNERRDAIQCLDLYEFGRHCHSNGLELEASAYPLYFEALSNSEAIIADDARTDIRTREFSSSYLEPLGITSMMDIPLILYGRLEGVLCHETVGVAQTWFPEDRLFGMAIANLVVLAIERIERDEAARRQREQAEQQRLVVEERLRQSEEQFHSLVSYLKIVVYQTDVDGRCIFLNPSWTNLTGYAITESIGTNLLDYVHPDDRKTCLQIVGIPVTNHRDYRTEVRFLAKNGTARWVEGFARPLFDASGAVVGTSGMLIDIHERKVSEAYIERLAYHDALTGLPNRTLLFDRLDRALAEAKRQSRNVALLFLDLDDFKGINDTFGHATGDILLTQMSARLKQLLREEDTVARYGGDEFLLILPNPKNPGDVIQVAVKALRAMAQPFSIEGHDMHVTASIGISYYPDDARERDLLLRCADLALYQAKDRGRNNYQRFELEPERRM